MYKKISNLIKKIFQDYYEVAVAISASSIILLAIILDKFMYLQACPMCILTRYVFGLIAVSAIVGILFKAKLIGGLLMALSSLIGLFVSSRDLHSEYVNRANRRTIWLWNAFSYSGGILWINRCD